MKIVLDSHDIIQFERDALEDLSACDLSLTDYVWQGTERPLSNIVVPLGNMVYSSISLPNWVDWNGERF